MFIAAKTISTFQKALSFGDHNWQRHCHDAFDLVGHMLDDQEIDEIIHEVDPALHNIVLDTPPDMFEVWGCTFPFTSFSLSQMTHER